MAGALPVPTLGPLFIVHLSKVNGKLEQPLRLTLDHWRHFGNAWTAETQMLFYDSLRSDHGRRKTSIYMDPGSLEEARPATSMISVCRNRQDRNRLNWGPSALSEESGSRYSRPACSHLCRESASRRTSKLHHDALVAFNGHLARCRATHLSVRASSMSSGNRECRHKRSGCRSSPN